MLTLMLFTLMTGCDAPAEASGSLDIDSRTAAALIEKDEDVVIVDVRTPREFAAGHLEGAVNVDFTSPTFKADIAKLPKDKTLLMHCQSGGRSRAALPAFAEAGFTDVQHMVDGYGGWSRAGLPSVR